MNFLKFLLGDPIEKRLDDKDTSDFSKEKILERSNEEQAEYLAILERRIEEDKKYLSDEDYPPIKKRLKYDINFYKEQIAKLKKYLSTEDFKKTQALTKNALVTIKKEDSIKSGITSTIAGIVILLIVIGFFSIFFSGEDCMSVEYVENGKIKTGRVCGKEAMSTMKSYQSEREGNLEKFR